MSCPICKKDTNKDYRPFCSKRCADVDLGKWLSGGYTYSSDEDEGLQTAISELPKKDDQVH